MDADFATSGGAVPLLQANGLVVQFDNTRALDGVDFAVHAGQLVGLIGPNGAGKTTLLRTLCGLQTPTGGVVKVVGRDLARDRDVRRFLGFTPDVAPLYDAMKVSDFLRFAGHCYQVHPNDIEERIDFWLDKLWLTDKRDQKIAGLSRGMKQRLGIARTLLPDPQVILLDEPASGLDPAGRVQFRQLLMTLREQGKALVVSSHVLADMGEYCSHIGIVSHGRMLRYGTVGEVSAAHESKRGQFRLTLTQPADAAMLAKLKALPAVAAVDIEPGGTVLLTTESAADPPAARQLLGEAVAAGLPVCGFAAVRVTLEDIYLKAGVRQVD